MAPDSSGDRNVDDGTRLAIDGACGGADSGVRTQDFADALRDVRNVTGIYGADDGAD